MLRAEKAERSTLELARDLQRLPGHCRNLAAEFVMLAEATAETWSSASENMCDTTGQLASSTRKTDRSGSNTSCSQKQQKASKGRRYQQVLEANFRVQDVQRWLSGFDTSRPARPDTGSGWTGPSTRSRCLGRCDISTCRHWSRQDK